MNATTSFETLRAADADLNAGRLEVAFIDTGVADWQNLADGVRAGIEVVLIDASQSGLAQMAQWAETHTGYDAIHLLSHGAAGSLRLGRDTLTGASLAEAGVQAELAQLGRALTAEGDLLLYGCEVAAGEAGQTFVANLAALTGADVAASADVTGAAFKSGNWVLEHASGVVEAQVAVNATVVFDYNSTLDSAPGTNLVAGDFAILQVSTTNNFVVFAPLVDVAAETTIYLSDQGWSGGITNAFAGSLGNEGTVSLKLSSNVSKGTLFKLNLGDYGQAPAVVRVADSSSPGIVSKLSGYTSTTTDPFGNLGDNFFIFTGPVIGPESAPSFIAGAHFSANSTFPDGWVSIAFSVSATTSNLPVGLTAGAVALNTNGFGAKDNFAYIGFTTETDRAGWLTRLTDRANFEQLDNIDPALAAFTSATLSFTSGLSITIDAANPALTLDSGTLAYTENAVATAISSGATLTEAGCCLMQIIFNAIFWPTISPVIRPLPPPSPHHARSLTPYLVADRPSRCRQDNKGQCPSRCVTE